MRRGEWRALRKELIATQADVEQAMIELRDQRLAHLISLGGCLRGLEISERQSNWIFRLNGQKSSRNTSWSITSQQN